MHGVRAVLHALPDRPACAWLAAGLPAGDASGARAALAGTDRQVRGRIMAVLRARDGPVHLDDVRHAAADATQVDRCVRALLADGLIRREGTFQLALPG